MDDSNFIKNGIIATFFNVSIVIGCVICCCFARWNDEEELNVSPVPSQSHIMDMPMRQSTSQNRLDNGMLV